jgi:hypothetical protein
VAEFTSLFRRAWVRLVPHQTSVSLLARDVLGRLWREELVQDDEWDALGIDPVNVVLLESVMKTESGDTITTEDGEIIQPE